MPPEQIFFFGDSITLADNDGERCGWPGRLCRGLEIAGNAVTAYNLGINGDTSRDIAARWQGEVAVRRLLEVRRVGVRRLLEMQQVAVG